MSSAHERMVDHFTTKRADKEWSAWLLKFKAMQEENKRLKVELETAQARIEGLEKEAEDNLQSFLQRSAELQQANAEKVEMQRRLR